MSPILAHPVVQFLPSQHTFLWDMHSGTVGACRVAADRQSRTSRSEGFRNGFAYSGGVPPGQDSQTQNQAPERSVLYADTPPFGVARWRVQATALRNKSCSVLRTHGKCRVTCEPGSPGPQAQVFCLTVQLRSEARSHEKSVVPRLTHLRSHGLRRFLARYTPRVVASSTDHS